MKNKLLLVALMLLTGSTALAQEPIWQDALQKRTIEGDDGYVLPYRYAAPPKTSGQTDAYPVVVFLHGAGERGDDNESQLVHGVADFMKRMDRHPAHLIAPQCPKGEKWVDINWDAATGSGSFPDAPSKSMAMVLKLVDELAARDDVDPARIYVTGLSMGGYGSWFAAANEPKRFAAMLALCGGGNPDVAGRYAGVALWAVHGTADTAVPVTRSREMISALAKIGHAGELRSTELPGVGHDCWTQTYARDDVHDWLFRQRK